jgi:hypothetical protein
VPNQRVSSLVSNAVRAFPACHQSHCHQLVLLPDPITAAPSIPVGNTICGDALAVLCASPACTGFSVIAMPAQGLGLPKVLTESSGYGRGGGSSQDGGRRTRHKATGAGGEPVPAAPGCAHGNRRGLEEHTRGTFFGGGAAASAFLGAALVPSVLSRAGGVRVEPRGFGGPRNWSDSTGVHGVNVA